MLEPQPYDGLTVLDSTFGYEPVMPALYPDDGTEQIEGDTPSEPFDSATTYIDILDSFTTYTLYRPPGQDSLFVPLKNLEWFWEGEAQPNSLGIWQIFNIDGGWSFLQDFPAHPQWNLNIEDSLPTHNFNRRFDNARYK